MRDDKRKRLESKGWKLGTTREFLELARSEEEYIEIRIRLAEALKLRRLSHGVTQLELAKAVRSSQSRIAKMEAGDPTVSVDLLIRTLLALGASNRDLGKIISGVASRGAA